MNHLRWLQLAGVWLLYMSFGLTVSSLTPVVPLLIQDLGLSHTQIGLALGAWQLVYVCTAIPASILIDRIGVRIALTLGGLLIGISALARAGAGDASSLILAVMLTGLGGPIMSAGAPKVVISSFTGSSRGIAMGIYVTGPAVGAIISLATTNSLLLPLFHQNWRAVFVLWGSIALLASCAWWAIATIVNVRSGDRRTEEPLRYGGALIELLRDRSVILVLLMSIFVFMFNHGLNNWLPALLQSHGYSPEEAGYWAAIPTVVGIAGSLVIPRLATPALRFRILFALSFAAMVASVLLRFSDALPLFLALLLQGIARSSLMTVLVLMLVELPRFSDRKAGISTGVFFAAAEFGGMLGPLLIGALYSARTGYDDGLSALSAIAALIMAGALYLGRVVGRQTKAAAVP